MRFLSVYALLILTWSLSAQQNLSVAESYIYGGNSYENANDVKIDSLGNKYICGTTLSDDGDFPQGQNGYDGYIMKLAPDNSVLWVYTIGCSGQDIFYAIHLTSNAIYVGGEFNGNSCADVPDLHGSEDGFITKLDLDGNLLWQKSYGGNFISKEKILSILEYDSNSLMIIGESNFNSQSPGPNSDLPQGLPTSSSTRIWIFKISKVDGSITDVNNYVYNTVASSTGGYTPKNAIRVDDGIIVVGQTNYTANNSCLGTGFRSLAFILKVDFQGNLIWENGFGVDMASSTNFYSKNVYQDNEENFLVIGSGFANSGTCDFPAIGDQEIIIVKVDQNGNKIWSESYGGNNQDFGFDVKQLMNSNYLVLGCSKSTDLGTPINSTSYFDVYLFEITKDGIEIGNRNLIGGGGTDGGGSDNNALIPNYRLSMHGDEVWGAVESNSDDFDVPPNSLGSQNIWLYKLGPLYNSSCSWIAYVNNPFTQERSPNFELCNVVANGELYIDPNDVNLSTYWSGFLNYNDFKVSAENSKFCATVSNSAADGGIICNDIEIWLLGESNSAAVGFMNESASCSSFTFVGTEDNFLYGDTEDLSVLQLNVDVENELCIETFNNSINIYINSVNVYSLSYTTELGNLYGIKIATKGSGKVKEVNVSKADLGDLIYSEKFDSCDLVCESCLEEMSLSQNSLPYGEYNSSGFINSTGTIGSNGNVEFNAQDAILLLPGFESSQGSIFISEIKNCQQ